MGAGAWRKVERSVSISLRLNEHSYPGCRAVLTWPSAHAPSLIDYLEVELAWHHTTWFVKLWLDFRGGPSWSRSGTFATRDEAAREAADLWTEGVRIVLARWRGEPIATPGDVMAEAWEQTTEGARLSTAVEAVLASRPQWRDEWPADYRERWAYYLRGKDETATAYYDARVAWLRAQDWRPYRDGVNNPSVHPDNCRRGQMALLEVA
jgi:hypothetical protein